ncbi:PREDICTED: growth-regulated protein homolog alpha-like [Chrysochloris asiatica]|uniref:C-X-C motif chemokine n=1 Tax=Chrysochloris asiatica TaxID=185453 RepID=A0A9B0TWL2_CHRAS|nr:PREDICTED: growth-regulated protein homolog alpha-like [Chrysochloris asiatica]
MTFTAAPRALRLLQAALLFLLLVSAGQRAEGAPVVSELRCQCVQTLQGIHFKNIQNVKVTPSGPHCGQTEVIATLKNGQEVCLNPTAPMVKRIIEKILKKPENRTLSVGLGCLEILVVNSWVLLRDPREFKF